MSLYIKYDGRLKERASENRRYQTRTEEIIWNKLLRSKKFFGYKFTRQKMLKYFIADFYCSKLKLIIEIDGNYHNERQEYDKERSYELNNLGLNIIRFTNSEVLSNLDLVHRKLYNYINT